MKPMIRLSKMPEPMVVGGDVPIYVDDGTGTGAAAGKPVDLDALGKSMGYGAAKGGTAPQASPSGLPAATVPTASPPPAPVATVPVASAPAPAPAQAQAPAPASDGDAAMTPKPAGKASMLWMLPAALAFGVAGISLIVAGLKKGK